MPQRTKYMQQFRSARLARGLCSRCGKNPPRSGFRTCGCDLVYQQQRNQELLTKGVCRRCSRKLDGAAQLCACCRKEDSKRKTARAEQRLKAGRCAACGERPALKEQNWCAVCCEKARSYANRIKLEVLQAYGSVCACCGETEPDFLTMDHMNGGGTAHRHEIRRSIYSWLKSRGFPKGYQVLCFNCNCGKGADGVCPHKRKKVA